MSSADERSAQNDQSDAAQPTNALPPVPLTEDQLEPLADHESIDAVYVPEGRPETVYTLAGGHRGDVLEFYVETTDQYVKYRYGPAEGGLAWTRCEPWSKEDPHVDLAERDLEDYRPLEVST